MKKSTAMPELLSLDILRLSHNDISDVMPVNKLKNLRVLTLAGNPISFAKPIGGLR